MALVHRGHLAYGALASSPHHRDLVLGALPGSGTQASQAGDGHTLAGPLSPWHSQAMDGHTLAGPLSLPWCPWYTGEGVGGGLPTGGPRPRSDKSLDQGLTFNRSQRGSCSATYETLTQNQVVCK